MEKARSIGRGYQKEVSAISFATRIVLTILALQTLYPNLVHEPLHKLALALFSYESQIVFDWIPPATPYVNYILSEATLSQVVIVFMLPSVVNVLLIAFLGTIRTTFPVIKIGAIAYLTFDLILNIRGFQSPTSDFRLLLLTDYSATLAIFMIIIIIALALWGIFRGVNRVKIVKSGKDINTTHAEAHR
jgi:hypothetical protein